ncbi:hypothetical protein GCM10027444_44530 [Actinopolyspora lacussalsi]
MEIGAAFPAGDQASKPVQQCEGVFDNQAHGLVGATGTFSAGQGVITRWRSWSR